MKRYLINSKQCFILLFAIFYLQTHVDAQKSGSQKLKTYSLGGRFAFGTNVEKESIGLVFVYPESDTTILFFIDVNRGAPSYNMGNLYGRLKIKAGTGIFNKDVTETKRMCTLEFKFQTTGLKISTLNYNDDCGFGFGVYADGVYKRKSKKVPEYFISMTGEKHFFKTTDPNTWEGD